MRENRLTDRLVRYWEQLRGDQALPSINRLNPERVMDLWPSCMTIHVVNMAGATRNYAYEHVGESLQKMYGQRMTGQIGNSKMRDLPGWQMLKKIDEVIVQNAVVYEEGQFVSSTNRIVKFRACILPFGVDDKVTHVVVGMSYKEF
jgi:hypothetical protein